MSEFDLKDLTAIIRARREAKGDTSYTRKLLDGGAVLCARKLGEEATELVIAAIQNDGGQIRDEAADLLYHLLVLLEAGNVRLEDVLAELQRRTA
ncbi:MAG: phosphoribosyl-ATP diphosphatase, partial [Fimbriimonadaceae bacterium]|nr:phosphoribosyl-ATP diphosphatase [Alphaproteobacteria bacterium]